MILSFKTQIFPTNIQIEYFRKCFGVRRWTWNYGVNWLKAKGVKDFNSYDIQKYINNEEIKDKLWLNEVNSMVRQEALSDLNDAVKHYKKVRTKESPFKGFPNFKKKKDCKNSFRMNNKGNPVKAKSKRFICLTTVKSKKNALLLKTAESCLFLNSKEIRFASITIYEKFDKFFLCINYEKNNCKDYIRKEKDKKVGIDCGIKTFLVLAEKKEKKVKYEEITLPKTIKLLFKQLDYMNNNLSKKDDKSKRAIKYKKLLNKKWEKLNNIRTDFRHKITTKLCKTYSQINIELFPLGKKFNKRINRSIDMLGLYAFTETLKWKATKYNSKITFIPKGTPTTQTCSKCGHRYAGDEKLTLKQRVFHCVKCGYKKSRDKNSARNILNHK
jgi:putative transposase